MMYEALASYYDALVKDDEATHKWVEFVKKHCPGKKVLELASGSGEITHALKEEGYEIYASDISTSMLKALSDKYPDIPTQCLDMRDFDFHEEYEGILCFCDSLNYLTEKDEVDSLFASVRKSLKQGGMWLFDMHTPDRLEEFEEEFLEEGYIGDMPYIWSISSEDNFIYQHFIFYLPDHMEQEQHIQCVFDPKDIEDMLEANGFSFEVYTDFDMKGKKPGEKYFYVARKER